MGKHVSSVEILTVENSLDPDKAQRSVGPGLDPSCFHYIGFSERIFKMLLLFVFFREKKNTTKNAKFRSM